ncbi:MAG TPA: selenide, water dikinase SelD [Xanthobacteraceae bacterium]|nr:selenide, water dikinase SelD [Xanthobacteraceae bacterium]
MNVPIVRLTSLAHGGGCGCKLAPSVLQQLLADQPAAQPYRQLLVGTETGDDAAVWEIDENTCIIATTDFFMPMVDDPFDFGRVAATNAISDVYAMGGKPIMALAILGMPIDKMAPDLVREILRGGAAICAEAGIPVAGGHSIDCPEPVYGLAVIGIAPRKNIRRNADAKAGDALILTKPLGVGLYSAAIKKDALPHGGYGEMIAVTTLLNRVGAALAQDGDVHAITDVTGFGVLGHALEMARGSAMTVALSYAALPRLAHAEELARAGCVTGASHRNWKSYADGVSLPDGLPDWQRHLLTDPQTSGGLLVACAPMRANDILATIVAAGYPQARIIGHTEAGPPRVRVDP